MAMKIGTVHLQIGHFPCLCNKWPEGKAAFCNFWWYPLVIEHGNGKSTTYRGFSAINHSKAPFWSGTSHFTAQPFAPQSTGTGQNPLEILWVAHPWKRSHQRFLVGLGSRVQTSSFLSAHNTMIVPLWPFLTRPQNLLRWFMLHYVGR